MKGLEARLVARRPGGFGVDVGLVIAPGSTVALLGPNGAGKSTVVELLAGLLPLSAGGITLGERRLADAASGLHLPPAARRIGVVFQDYALFPHLSVLDNVAFGPRSRGAGRAQARSEGLGWLARLGIKALSDRRPPTLSGGQAQRVALARALAAGPELLLLDEPLAALDVTTRVEMRRVLARHLGEFTGPRLLITHDPTEAFLLADEVLVIENGEVSQAGTAEEIRLRPRTRYAADLAGSNLLHGTAAGGRVDVGTMSLRVADSALEGPVLVTVHPRAISVHLAEPEGSPRNGWRTTVELVEDLGERIRLNVGTPLPLTVELTPDSVDDLHLESGAAVWVSIKATEIGLEAR